MSTFLGLIKEIPGILVDCFDNEILTSSSYIFFLSHCHTDHMKGLSNTFFEYLYKSNKYLYCSPITKALLESKFSFQNYCVKEIDINAPTVIEYELQNKEKILISVTCIPAGHCLGSIMFMFEINNMSILYTGDFRINPIDFPKLKGLHYYEYSRLLPRTFTKIYLDTTFLNYDFPCFPTRKESLDKMSDVIKHWIHEDPRNVVILECSATYGSEFLFVELSKILNMKIHVKDNVYRSYCRIQQLCNHITNDPSITPIHACTPKISSSYLMCRPDVHNVHIMTIIPSAMKWRKKDTSVVGEWDKVKDRTFNVCYSMHSSLNELKAFIQYFNALEIYACVVRPEEKKEMYCLLDKIRKKSDKQETVKQTYQLELPTYKILNKLPFKSEYFSSDDDSI
ncbi:DNA cross-link repair protein snm1 [Ptiloglossa arizonensis]|uniref:DNA cross-link repair protein snm1 n=1 Tax=Ptiloglossa arizonensis TaxID=3350558 RepID=UPI003FA0B948